MTIVPVFENGEVTKLRGAGNDITERKEFEQQLRRNVRKFEALFNDPNLLVGLSEGTGFGLRIVKQVADAHGWEVAVTESEQGGARFEITGVEFAGR